MDEHNKYIYYQVVDMPHTPLDSLKANAAEFVRTEYPKIKTKESEGSTSIADKFLTYAAFVKHETGEIDYNITIECKDHKYRYWLTDFVFTPYQKDRYGNFVPQQGISIPLENVYVKFDKKEATGYLDQTGAFSKKLGEKLKLYMTNAPAPKKAEIVKKVVTDKW